MAVTFYNLNESGLKKLDEYLLTRSYISGYQASKDDITVHSALAKAPSSGYVNASRWYNHIDALLRISGVSEESAGVTVEGFAPVPEETVATPSVTDSKAAVEDDDDDDVDLFGEETEEEKAASEARAAAVKASGKKKESGKSSVLLDVKPWDDETDMVKLEEIVRSVQMEGLLWGASKLVAVGYGIKKLTIMMTIVDDLVSVDNLIEDHLTCEPANEYIQSCDIVAFNKILREMQGLNKSSKAQYPLIIVLFTLLLVACLVFNLSSNPIEEGRRLVSSLSNTTHNDTAIDHRELAKVLMNATMEDRTVILTTLNEAWATPGSVIDLFLESFHIGEGTERLLDHLVIVAMDQKAFNRCKSIHPHCFSLTTPGVNFAAEKRFMTPDYLKLMWRRIEFLQTVLELGYSFLFTDTDIMWFRDPFPHFDSLDEFTIACDFYTGNLKDRRNRANGGFNFVKSDARSIEFYKYWYMSRILYPKSHDQSVFEKIKNDKVVTSIGYKIKYLDTAYFGGFCEPSKDMNKVTTMHANCCVGIERKIHDLRLVLEDWKNFTALSSEEKRLRGSSSSISPWRAPKKCKAW